MLDRLPFSMPKEPKVMHWTQKDLETLRRHYGTVSNEALARMVGRSVRITKKRADREFPAAYARMEGAWSDEDVERLCFMSEGDLDQEEWPRVLRRTKADVDAMTAQLVARLRSQSGACVPWSSKEHRRLKVLYGTHEDSSLALLFGRWAPSVRAEARRLKLSKCKVFERMRGRRTRMPRWTAEDVAYLRSHYPTEPNQTLAEVLDRSSKSVVSKAHLLGLSKSPERLAEMGRENVKSRYRSER